MIDIGANLTNRQFQRDLPGVLRRAAAAGVTAVVVTGTSLKASADAVRLAQRFGASSGGDVPLFATVGVHPHDAKDFDARATPAAMRELIQRHGGTVVAVGECGLDFNRNFSPRDAQESAFRAQVELACDLRLPLFLHEREAHTAFVGILAPFLEAQLLPPVVVHCFTGNEDELRAYVKLGFYIGVTGFVCMDRRGRELRAIASIIPLDRLLVETDAPFMYPYGNNTRARCEPKDVCAVVETLASCYGVTPGEIARHTTANATRFFGLDRQLAPTLTPTAHLPPTSAQDDEAKPVNAVQGDKAVELDGGSGEGGGQLLRISMALAPLVARAVRVHSIRANRKVPGLRNQHLGTVELARDLSRATLTGAHLNSTDVTLDCRGVRGPSGGTFRAESRTGGSVSLMVQGVLPIACFSAAPTEATLKGGTHVAFSPSIDFMGVALRSLVARFGLQFEVQVNKRLFTPGGPMGEAVLSVDPVDGALQPVDLTEFSPEISRVFTRVTIAGPSASEAVAHQHSDAVKAALAEHLAIDESTDMDWDYVVEVTSDSNSKSSRRGRPSQHRGQSKAGQLSVSILCVLYTASGAILSVDRSGPARSTLDFAVEIAKTLASHMKNGVCVDEHLADNAVVFMALANGTSRLRVPGKADRTSQHLETALDVVHRLVGVSYSVKEEATSAVIEVNGAGFLRRD